MKNTLLLSSALSLSFLPHPPWRLLKLLLLLEEEDIYLVFEPQITNNNHREVDSTYYDGMQACVSNANGDVSSTY
jgi:hypothetical protein